MEFQGWRATVKVNGSRLGEREGIGAPQCDCILVDTGATHTIIPPSLARKVGAPTLPQRFEVSLADGTKRKLKACSIGA